VNRQLDRFHFNEAAKAIYEFTWSDFCDWYIEIAKTRFYGNDTEKANVARAVSVHVIKGILRLLHPYAPFITEELWAHFRDEKDADLIVTLWLNGDPSFEDKEADGSITLLKDIITAVRTIRSGMNVPPGKKADLVIRNVNGNKALIESFDEIIRTLGHVEDMTLGGDLEKPDQSATAVVQKMELFVPLKGLIDLEQEYARFSKRLGELERHLQGVKKKLGNKNFMNSAPANVVENEKKKLQDMTVEFELVKANLEMLQ
jgi:valyl-tRNA synthetase